MSAALIAELREHHRQMLYSRYCLACRAAWPCEGQRAADALERVLLACRWQQRVHYYSFGSNGGPPVIEIDRILSALREPFEDVNGAALTAALKQMNDAEQGKHEDSKGPDAARG